MGYAEDVNRGVKSVDDRIEAAAAPLRSGVEDLEGKLAQQAKDLNTLASKVTTMRGDLNQLGAFVMALAKKIGFDQSESKDGK